MVSICLRVIGDKSQEMLGSYNTSEASYTKTFPKEEMPKGMIQRGEYTVKSRFIDDDNHVYLDLAWVSWFCCF